MDDSTQADAAQADAAQADSTQAKSTQLDSTQSNRRMLNRMRKWARQRAKKEIDENVIVISPALKYKDEYVKAFESIVQPDADFISGLPTETIHDIFSYLIIDHDPDRGVKAGTPGNKAKAHPHVLISLAAMSRRFHGLVENFSLSHMMKFDHGTSFRTNAERAKDTAKRVESHPKANVAPRRSGRLAAKSGEIEHEPERVYRTELVKYLRTHCIECNTFCYRPAVMATGVACCPGKCDNTAFPDQINLTDALRQYDLRDYMLLKSRTPGPRAKHTNLPVIPYGSAYIAMGYRLGWGVTYKFLRKDVKTIAELVHGDVTAHMTKKRQKHTQRKDERLLKLHVELKISYHTQMLAYALVGDNDENPRYHQKMLDEFKDPQWEGNYPDDMHYHDQYVIHEDDLWDVHQRICAIAPCEDCLDDRAERSYMRRYHW